MEPNLLLTWYIVIPQSKPSTCLPAKLGRWSKFFFHPPQAQELWHPGFIWLCSPTLSPGYSLTAAQGDEAEECGVMCGGCPCAQVRALVSCGDLCALWPGP